MEKKNKLGLCVSVGGSKGAYAGGIIEYYLRSGKKYDVLVGSSTGSLIVPLAAAGNYRDMKIAYTNITNKDIFTRNPIKIKLSKNGMHKYTVNYWNIFKNLLIYKQSTLGDTTKLKDTIYNFFPQKDYLKILSDGINLSIMVTNLTTQTLEQKYLIDYTYEEFCLSKDTEILTDKGFVGMNEIKKEDLILSYNNNELIYEKPERLIFKNFKGKMIHFEGENFECLVTPNHKMGYFRNSSIRTDNGRKSRWLWDTKNSEEFLDIGEKSIKYNYKFPVSGHIKQKNCNISEDEIKFIGWMITKGWIKKDSKYKNNCDYSVAQSYEVNPITTKKLTKVIESLNLDYNGVNRKGMKEFNFRRKSRVIIEKLFNGSEIKRIPKYILSGCSEIQLEFLFESMMDGDGCWSNMTFGTKFYELAQDFQELCHKIGRVGKLKKTQNYKGDFFLIYVMKKDTPRFLRKVEEVNYDDKVWCVTVPSGFIVTRYKNKISVLGNCDWMWASTCAPPFMSLAKIGNFEYVDGGILSQVPIKQALLDGCDEIDIIVLAKENPEEIIEKVRNLFHYQMKVLLTMMNKLKHHQTDLGYLTQFTRKNVRLNFHYTERRLTNNSLIFDSKLMTKWWEEGFEYAKLGRCTSYIINGRTKKYTKIDQ